MKIGSKDMNPKQFDIHSCQQVALKKRVLSVMQAKIVSARLEV